MQFEPQEQEQDQQTYWDNAQQQIKDAYKVSKDQALDLYQRTKKQAVWLFKNQAPKENPLYSEVNWEYIEDKNQEVVLLAISLVLMCFKLEVKYNHIGITGGIVKTSKTLAQSEQEQQLKQLEQPVLQELEDLSNLQTPEQQNQEKQKQILIQLIQAIFGVKVDKWDNLEEKCYDTTDIGQKESGVTKLQPQQRLQSAIKAYQELFFRKQHIEKQILTLIELMSLVSENSISPGNLMKVLPDIMHKVGVIFKKPVHALNGICALTNGNYEQLTEMVSCVCDFDPSQTDQLSNILNKLDYMIKEKQKESEQESKKSGMSQEMLNDLNKKIREGKATNRELFDLCDNECDMSGTMNKEEFKNLTKKLNQPLSDHRVNEIFAKVKQMKIAGMQTDENQLSFEEFEIALRYLEEKSIFSALEILGISTRKLIILFLYLVLLLLLMFIFIFMGINAFGMGGSFESVINSILPIGAGAAVGGKKPETADEGEEDNQTEGAVAETETIITTEE